MDLIAKDPENYEELKVAIKNFVKFNTSHYSDNFLKRRIEVRLRYNNLESYKDYSVKIKKDIEEQKKLKKELTIHTTNFYRDVSFYNAFRNEVIPKVKEFKKDTKIIKVWSAGSSTGEEALTIAICFLEELGEDLGGYHVSIIGTDFDAPTAQKAREAKYEIGQFHEMPKELVDKYFEINEIDDEKFYSPKDFVKKLTIFTVGDILSPMKPQNNDIIFCRNTVIYFDAPTKTKLYEDIFNILPENGFFIMGKTETLLGPSREKFNTFNMDERIYLKEKKDD
jgi:chemotaxis protein methyltransferase CheR